MAVRLLVVSLALAAGATRRAKAVPSEDCIVTSTSVDGIEERRDCYVLTESETKPGTKGRFESCTQ